MMISAAAHRSRRPKPCGRFAAAGLSVIAMLTPFSPATGTAEAEPDCPSVQMIFARGTFEQPGVGATGQAFVDAVSDRLGGKSMDVYAANYPASLDFKHAAEGIVDVRNKVQSVATTCPSTKIVLGGYSQGAAVVGYTLEDTIPVDYELPTGITGPMPAAMADHIAAVALFGTPGAGFMALFQRNAPPIVIGNPYLARTIQLCETGDPVCSPGGRDRAAHSAYKDNGMAVEAAEFAVGALTRTPTA